MDKQLLIIKIGGSVITDKNSATPKARHQIITNLAKDLADISKKYRLILVHGAGSFAHPLVKKSGINRGMSTPEQKLAFAQENIDMLTLNNLFTQALVSSHIACTSFPPHSFIKKTKTGLYFDTTLIEDYLKQSIIPVLYGDMILDDKQNSSVLSGDVIISYLAGQLNPAKIIFLSDVDGIFDSDPKKNPDAKLISEITNENLDTTLKGLSVNNPFDVTGEMKGKILEIKNEIQNIEVILANGLKPQILKKVLDQSQVGTKLLFE